MLLWLDSLVTVVDVGIVGQLGASLRANTKGRKPCLAGNGREAKLSAIEQKKIAQRKELEIEDCAEFVEHKRLRSQAVRFKIGFGQRCTLSQALRTH